VRVALLRTLRSDLRAGRPETDGRDSVGGRELFIVRIHEPDVDPFWRLAPCNLAPSERQQRIAVDHKPALARR